MCDRVGRSPFFPGNLPIADKRPKCANPGRPFHSEDAKSQTAGSLERTGNIPAGTGGGRALKGFIAFIDRTNEWLGSWIRIILYVFIGLICFEVMLRYVFNKPTIQLPVIVTMTAAAMYVLSFGNIMRNDGHVRIDIFYRLLSKRGKAAVEIIFGALFFFPVIGALVFSAAGWTWYAWSIDERDTQTFWYARIGPIRTIVLIGLTLFLLQGVAIFARNLEILFGRKNPHD
jgi:TRAP-type mannitol/chloroaromatic compound transport system permease small subunit